MSLQSLTNGQTITIDDHKRGCREHKDWNNPSADIHLHKSTNDTNDPKAVSIRIPLNNPERPVYIENTHRHQKREEVPTWLRKEIEKTLNNKKLREKFLKGIVKRLDDYKWPYSNVSHEIFHKEIKKLIEKIAKGFNLKVTEETTELWSNIKLERFTQILTNDSNKRFKLVLKENYFRLGECEIKERRK